MTKKITLMQSKLVNDGVFDIWRGFPPQSFGLQMPSLLDSAFFLFNTPISSQILPIWISLGNGGAVRERSVLLCWESPVGLHSHRPVWVECALLRCVPQGLVAVKSHLRLNGTHWREFATHHFPAPVNVLRKPATQVTTHLSYVGGYAS